MAVSRENTQQHQLVKANSRRKRKPPFTPVQQLPKERTSKEGPKHENHSRRGNENFNPEAHGTSHAKVIRQVPTGRGPTEK